MKILPHDLKQIKYKILWLYSKKYIFFVFLNECSENGSFEWFLAKRNGLGPLGVKVKV